MKIYENLWKSMEIYKNLWKSIRISENQWKSAKIHENPKIYVFWKKKMGYILYSKHINASHSVLQRELNCLNRENENHGFPENMDFDLQNACQSHMFHEHLKWSRGHYGHFAPAGLTGNPDRSLVFDKSVETHFSKSLGLSLGSVLDYLT